MEVPSTGPQHSMQHCKQATSHGHRSKAKVQEQLSRSKTMKENRDMGKQDKTAAGAANACERPATVWPANASSVSITHQYTAPCGLHYAYVGDVLCFLHQSSGKLYPLRKGAVIPSTGLRAQLVGYQHNSGYTHIHAHTHTHTHTHTQTHTRTHPHPHTQQGSAHTHTQQGSSHTHTPAHQSSNHTPATPTSGTATGAQNVLLSRDLDRERSASKALAGVAVHGGLQNLPDNVLEHIGRQLVPKGASEDIRSDAAHAAVVLACCGSIATLMIAQGAWGMLDRYSLDVMSWVEAMGGTVLQCVSLHAGPLCRPHASAACHAAMKRLIQLADPLHCPVRTCRQTALQERSRQEVPVIESVTRYGLSMEELLQITPSGGRGHQRGAVRRSSMSKHGYAKFLELEAQPKAKVSRKKAGSLEEQYRTLAASTLLARHHLTIDTLPETFGIQQLLMDWVKMREKRFSKQTPAMAVEVAVQRHMRLMKLTAVLTSQALGALGNEYDCAHVESRLCFAYVIHGEGQPVDVLAVMAEMRFFRLHTRYSVFLPALGHNSERAKDAALNDYVLGFPSPSDAAEAPSVPDSLKDRIRLLKPGQTLAKHIRFT